VPRRGAEVKVTPCDATPERTVRPGPAVTNRTAPPAPKRALTMKLPAALPTLRTWFGAMACATLVGCGGAQDDSGADTASPAMRARTAQATIAIPTETEVTAADGGEAVDMPTVGAATPMEAANVLIGSAAVTLPGTGFGRMSLGCTPTERSDFIDKTFWVFRRLMPRDCRVVMDNPVSFSWTQPKDRNPNLPWTLRIYNAAGQTVSTLSLNAPRATLVAPLSVGKYTWTVSYTTTGGVVQTSAARRFEINGTTGGSVLPTASQLQTRLMSKPWPRVLPAGATWAGITVRAKAGEYANAYSMLSRTANTSVLAPLTASPESRTKASFPTEGDYVKWLLALMQQTGNELRHLEVLSYAWRFTGNAAYISAAKARLMNLVAWDPAGASSERNQPQANRNLYLAMAMGYDLIGSELTSAERTALSRAFNARLAGAMKSLAELDAQPYLGYQNTAIQYVTRSLLHVVGQPGFADTGGWLARVWPMYQAQFQALGEEDGGLAGSVAYAWYEMPVVSQTLATLAVTAGLDLSKWGFAHRMGDYMIAMTAPNRDLPNAVGDGAEMTTLYRQYTADAFRLYASVTRSPQHEWYWRQRPENISLLGYINPLHYMLLGRNLSAVSAAAPTQDDFIFEDAGLVAFHDSARLADRSSVTFHSARFGSFSHGHADQNSFTLTSKGVPLLINSGYYPYFASPHHAKVTRTTRYKNAVTFDGGIGQAESNHATTVPTAPFQSMEARGRLLNASSTNGVAVATGDAALAYRGWDATYDTWRPMITGAIRSLAYFKSDGVLVTYDWLTSASARRFEWNYHGVEAFTTSGSSLVANNGSRKACIDHYGIAGNLALTTAFDVAPEYGGANQGHARFSAASTATKAVVVTVIREACTTVPVNVAFTGDSAKVTVGSRAVTMNGPQVSVGL
jgi:Heparinase II/III-like protein/Domain of unknown function (DUF4962)